ncbi:MAG: hypothetical protein ACI3ZZ_05110 [Candidatus Aphodosoma sp.]
MKLIKFFSLAVIAMLALVSCGNGETPAPFGVYFDGELVADKATITVTEVDEIAMEMPFYFMIENESDKSFSVNITEKRNYDLSKFNSSLCINECLPGNGEETQVWTVENLPAGMAQEIQYHLAPKDTENAAKADVQFTVTNGDYSMSFTVTFDYPGVN